MNKHAQHKNYSNEWETPPEIFEDIRAAYEDAGHHFVIDVAANFSNRKLNAYISESAEVKRWDHEYTRQSGHQLQANYLWFCNPPYSLVREFIATAMTHLATTGFGGVMLLPANIGTRWCYDLASVYRLSMMMWPRRIKFLHPVSDKSGNTGGSLLIDMTGLDLCPPVKDGIWMKPYYGQKK